MCRVCRSARVTLVSQVCWLAAVANVAATPEVKGLLARRSRPEPKKVAMVMAADGYVFEDFTELGSEPPWLEEAQMQLLQTSSDLDDIGRRARENRTSPDSIAIGRGNASLIASTANAMTGYSGLIVCGVMWTAMWAGLFYFLSWRVTCDCSMPRSTKDHENDKYWIARCVLGMVHGGFVSIFSVPLMLSFLSAPREVQFFTPRDIDWSTCSVYEGVAASWNTEARWAATVGLAFTSFTMVDMVISLVHKFASLEYAVHHFAFIAAGLIIRVHCMLPLNSAILLAMESSTASLNYVLLYRHRGSVYKAGVGFHGMMFALIFVVMRIGFNTYGTVVLWKSWLDGDSMPAELVPRYQAVFLLVCVTLGAAMQYYWFPAVLKAMSKYLYDGKTEQDPPLHVAVGRRPDCSIHRYRDKDSVPISVGDDGTHR